MMHIVVLGDLNLDIHVRMPEVPAPGDETREAILVRPGGSAGTFARTAAALGARVTFVGAVGADIAGDMLEASLRRSGVEPVLSRSDLPSGAVLALDRGEDRSMVCARGANDALKPDTLSEDLFQDVTHVHVSGYALLSDGQQAAATQAFSRAAARGVSCSVDPPPAGLIRAFGVERFLGLLPAHGWLFPNLSEGQLLSSRQAEDDIADVLSKRCPVGAVTLGAQGALAWSPAARDRARLCPLAGVDPTGAGDVYAATFVVGFLESKDLRQANRVACEAAWNLLCGRLPAGA